MKIPLFFIDNSENLDHELLLDYFLGWTLRCSCNENEDIKLRHESKQIVSYIIYGRHEEFDVESVKTWKQWNQIDLCAEFVITKAGKTEKYAILFENKMYTHISNGQLEKYKSKFENFYTNPINNKTEYHRMYNFLTCFYKEFDYKADFLECEKHGYKSYSFGWLKSNSKIKPTGNDLFDEFWFRYWK